MSISYVQATWTPTVLAALFDHYEIERTEDGGATFYQVADITTEAVNVYRDYDATRGGTAGYRLRVVRQDGAVSDWTATESEVLPTSTSWAFTSNEAPDLNMEVEVWSDESERHVWEMPPNEREYSIAGRDGAVVLKGLEDNLDTFMLAILVSDTAHDGLERAVATPLKNLSRETLAYVCVHSPASLRWLANVTVSKMEQTFQRQVYTLPTRIRELTKVPAVIDVAEV